ncbi:hypothetical protein GCM10009665_35840 [Kitasatospora nipponensis]|uniref:Excreted virulence factor EspC (Type VII ESX diderm) n=1 Tax=Kitasatospora nipponensis TaxID=258049 RepID=A0ABN1W9T5_9ACTN
MADGQFQVHPAALTSLGGKFGTESQGLTKQTATFTGSAAEIGEAFGLLGACDGAMAQYVKLFTSTSKALGQLSQVLAANDTRLKATAASYASTDQSVEAGAKSVGRAV